MGSMNLKQYFSKIGSKGGSSGKGKSKARTSKQARAAAKARWSKRNESKT